MELAIIIAVAVGVLGIALFMAWLDIDACEQNDRAPR